MAESNTANSPFPGPSPESIRGTKKGLLPLGLFLSAFAAPVLLAVLVYWLDSFDPAPFPPSELTRRPPLFVPRRNAHMLNGSEKIGYGRLSAPEDILYDPKTGVIYTGCLDGWVKRVKIDEPSSDGSAAVEDWVNTGGRPLGLAFGDSDDVIVADAYKGLLKISRDGKIELLSAEAEGLKFKLTDAVAVANDGMIYFTDASYKYHFHDFVWDILEGRPHGRFLRYNPLTRQTVVIARDLYFANGVALSADGEYVIFCETPMRRCKKYHLRGEKEGTVGVFVDNLPGMPDNIRYDGEGRYWIAISLEYTYLWELAQRYPFLRKIIGILENYTGRPNTDKNGGVLAVDLEGKATEFIYDREISLISTGIKIGDSVYFGSIVNPYIIRLNTTRYPSVSLN